MNQQPNAIVYLEFQQTRLYGELIQVIPKRELCWVRPLWLVKIDQDNLIDLYDLLECHCDLLWPTSFFRAAYDVELLPILTKLSLNNSPPNPLIDQQKVVSDKFNQFINQVWKADPNAFAVVSQPSNS